MATKKPPTKRRAAPRAKPADGFLDKYGGILKMFDKHGVAALFGGYLLVVTVPEMQKQAKEDRAAGREHGDIAVKEIAASINGLRDGFGSVQAVTQGKQSQIIDRIEKTNQILEAQRTGVPIPPLPME